MRAIDATKKEMQEGVGAVLSGREHVFHSEGIFPHLIVEYLESLGFKKGELETNGWQYDWWITFSKKEARFRASGGGYYGDFMFEKSSPEED